MTTFEAEIMGPVDLTVAGGRQLNSAARGWSRHPQHDARLSGPWGRRKCWDYWSIQAGDLVISGVVANVDYLSTSDVWWVDLSTARTGGRAVTAVGRRGFRLPSRFGSRPVRVTSKNYACELNGDDDHRLHLDVHWKERSGEPGELRAVIDMPPGQESLNVVIPWSDSVFQYTSKHQARPASGHMTVGDRSWVFAHDAWGILDIGRGRWPYSTRWNWGGGSGLSRSGSRIGIQVGGKWTEGTGFTENGVFVDGRLSKIGRELTWLYDWENPMTSWRVIDPGGQIEIELVPRFDKYSKLDVLIARRETHQVFGAWSGFIVDDDGIRHDVDSIQGFAEECRARW